MQNPNKDEQKYIQVQRPKFCSNCGKGLLESANFCVNCGTPVKILKPVVTEDNVSQEQIVSIKKESQVVAVEESQMPLPEESQTEVTEEPQSVVVEELQTPLVEEPHTEVTEEPKIIAAEVLQAVVIEESQVEPAQQEVIQTEPKVNLSDVQDIPHLTNDDKGCESSNTFDKSVAVTENFAMNQGSNDRTVETPGYPYLIREKTQEKIMIDQPFFRIGKEMSYCQYLISDNNAVSRNHADIVTKNGIYFIIDNKSTNGTYVNEQLIPVHTEVKILSGTKLRLANEDFVFYN